MTSSTKRHNDLPDTTLDTLLADLHDVYTTPTPPPGLRAAIERLEEEPMSIMPPTRPTARRFAPRRRGSRVLAVAGVLAAVVGIGAAIADSGMVQQALSLLPGGIDQRYTMALNQSRSACGYTIALKTAYADQNRLVVGYDVDVPPGRAFAGIDLAGLTATDARGTRLAPLNAADTSNLTHAAGAAHGNVQEFDTGAALLGKTLRVRLAAPALRGEEIVTGTAPVAPSCETDGAVGVTQNYGYGKMSRAVTVAGPFAFDITIPLSPKVREAAPHLSGTSQHGTTVTLERIVVTPTEARLFVRGPDRPRAFFFPTLYAGGVGFDAAEGTPIGHGLWVWRFFPRLGSPIDHRPWLFDDHGVWTIKVLTDSIDVHNSSEWTRSVSLKVTVP